jgi:hypothetical protein
VPVSDTLTTFGLGDNQIGAKLSGHSDNSYTRYGVAVLSSIDGEVNLPTSQRYDAYVTAGHAIDAGASGIERLGGYAPVGQRATYFQTSGGAPIPSTGSGNKSFIGSGSRATSSSATLNCCPSSCAPPTTRNSRRGRPPRERCRPRRLHRGCSLPRR